MKPDSTGYDPGEDSEEFVGTVVFDLEKFGQHYTSRVAAMVRRDGESVGLIYLDSEAEFDWLRKRIQGEFEIPEGEEEKSHA